MVRAVIRVASSALALSLVVSALCSSAAAQSGGSAAEAQERTERARFLFGEGVACVQSEDWACAERSFRAALALRDAPTIRYNLALALYRLGRYPEAARQGQAALDSDELSAEVRRQSESLQSEIERSAARLTIVLGPGAAGASVQIDGHEVPETQLAGAVPVAEGRRLVSALRGEEELASESVDAVAGESHTVELDVPLASDGQDPPLLEDWRFWVAVGGAAALLLTVVTIVAVAASSGGQSVIEGDYEPGVLRWD